MPSQLQAKSIFEQLLAVQCATAKTAMQLKNAIVGNHLLMTVVFRRLHSVTLRFYFKACQIKRQSNWELKIFPDQLLSNATQKNKNNKERGSREMTAHVAVNARQCQLSVRERSSAAKKTQMSDKRWEDSSPRVENLEKRGIHIRKSFAVMICSGNCHSGGNGEELSVST